MVLAKKLMTSVLCTLSDTFRFTCQLPTIPYQIKKNYNYTEQNDTHHSKNKIITVQIFLNEKSFVYIPTNN